MKRTPKNYDGLGSPLKLLSDLLPPFSATIRKKSEEPVKELLAAWPNLIGDPMASYTEAISFIDGVLLVKVLSSALYSVLQQGEKAHLLRKVQERFPSVKQINVFRG